MKLTRARPVTRMISAAALTLLATALTAACTSAEHPDGRDSYDVLGLPTCNDTLMGHLNNPEGAVRAGEANELIRAMQADIQRCTPDQWDPRIRETIIETEATGDGEETGPPRLCFENENPRLHPTVRFDALTESGAAEGDLAGDGLWRNRDNDVVVEFEVGREPSDIARCWIISDRGYLSTTHDYDF